MGGSVLRHSTPTSYPPGDFSPSGLGSLRFNKAARLRLAKHLDVVAFPAPPVEPTTRSFNILEAIIPVLGAVVIASVLQQPRFLVFGLLSPFLIGGRFLAARKQSAEKLAQDTLVFEQEKAAALTQLDAAKLAERQHLERRYPPLVDLLQIASRRLVRLWERRPEDIDFLHIRLGVCTKQSLSLIHI